MRVSQIAVGAEARVRAAVRAKIMAGKAAVPARGVLAEVVVRLDGIFSPAGVNVADVAGVVVKAGV